jgi:hypothetical protein
MEKLRKGKNKDKTKDQKGSSDKTKGAPTFVTTEDLSFRERAGCYELNRYKQTNKIETGAESKRNVARKWNEQSYKRLFKVEVKPLSV